MVGGVEQAVDGEGGLGLAFGVEGLGAEAGFETQEARPAGFVVFEAAFVVVEGSEAFDDAVLVAGVGGGFSVVGGGCKRRGRSGRGSSGRGCLRVQARRERAEDEAIRIFGKNLKDLLLAAPAGQHVTMGIDPGIRTGCKIAVVDTTGKLLATETIYPHEPRRQWDTSLQVLRAQAQTVRLGDEVIALLSSARERAKDTQQTVSDRRWRQTAALLQLQAASRYATEVSVWDAWLLPFTLAADPDQVPGWTDWFLHTVARATPLAIDGLERAAAAFEQQLDVERRAPADAQDDSAGKLALARAITRPGEESEMVRITSERAQRRYSPVHIQARVAQCDELLERLMALHGEWLAVAHAVLAEARSHDWLPPSWLLQIEAAHAERCGQLAGLCAQHQSTRNGFADLPVDAEATANAPAPVHWESP